MIDEEVIRNTAPVGQATVVKVENEASNNDHKMQDVETDAEREEKNARETQQVKNVDANPRQKTTVYRILRHVREDDNVKKPPGHIHKHFTTFYWRRVCKHDAK